MQGAIPGRDLDTAQATLVQAQATYDIARQHLESLEKVSNRAALQMRRALLLRKRQIPGRRGTVELYGNS